MKKEDLRTFSKPSTIELFISVGLAGLASPLLDKYSHTLDSVLRKMPTRQGRMSLWTCQEACWMYLLAERASIHERKGVLWQKA